MATVTALFTPPHATFDRTRQQAATRSRDVPRKQSFLILRKDDHQIPILYTHLLVDRNQYGQSFWDWNAPNARWQHLAGTGAEVAFSACVTIFCICVLWRRFQSSTEEIIFHAINCSFKPIVGLRSVLKAGNSSQRCAVPALATAIGTGTGLALARCTDRSDRVGSICYLLENVLYCYMSDRIGPDSSYI